MAPSRKRSKLNRAKEAVEETHDLSALSAVPAAAVCVPEEVIFFNILVLLSFKTLAKFKCVCRRWYDFISGHPLFPLSQGRRAISSAAASGMVYSCCRKNPLTILQTSGAPIGVPDPQFTFVPGRCLYVLASTNGLICLQLKANNSSKYLYVCNPVTKEGHVVPDFKFNYWSQHVGLAFDPISSPDNYKLVCLQQDFYKSVFKVFSSETCKWVESSQKLDVLWYIKYKYELLSNIYIKGVLYWNVCHGMLYYDAEKDAAGITPWPFKLHTNQDLLRQGSHNIGVCKGRVTCTRFSTKSGLQMWIMSSAVNGRWEKKFHMNLEKLVGLNLDVLGSYWRMTTLRSRKLSGVMTSDNYIVPLAFSGGKELYLWVRKRKKVLCFDMDYAKATEFYKNIKPILGGAFLYVNSMIPLPKLSQLPSPLV